MSTEEIMTPKKIFFNKLDEQIRPEKPEEEEEKDAPDESTENCEEGDSKSDDKVPLLWEPVEVYLQKQYEEDLRKETEEPTEKPPHPDEIFYTKEAQLKGLKLKVCIEYFLTIRKTNRTITPQQLASWLSSYPLSYNSTKTVASEKFDIAISEDSLRKKITKYIEIRSKLKKPLFDQETYKKVDLNFMVYKNRSRENAHEDRQDEIAEIRLSKEYNQHPNTFAKNPAYGNKVKIFFQKISHLKFFAPIIFC